MVDHSKQSWSHSGRCLIPQPNDDNTRSLAVRSRKNVSEFRSKASTILLSATAFAAICGSGRQIRPSSWTMDDVVTGPAQRFHGRERHAQVGEESHAALLLKRPISSFASAEAYYKD